MLVDVAAGTPILTGSQVPYDVLPIASADLWNRVPTLGAPPPMFAPPPSLYTNLDAFGWYISPVRRST